MTMDFKSMTIGMLTALAVLMGYSHLYVDGPTVAEQVEIVHGGGSVLLVLTAFAVAIAAIAAGLASRKFEEDTRGQAPNDFPYFPYVLAILAIILVWEMLKRFGAWVSTLTLDGATAATVSWATTPSVSPLGMGLLVVAATGLTAVAVWMWENPRAGLKDDTRGQVSNPGPWIGMATMFAVVGVALQVMKAVGIDPENIEQTCLGLFACGWPGPAEITVAAVPIVAIVAIFVWAARGGIPPRIG